MRETYEVTAYYQTSKTWRIKAKNRQDAIDKANDKSHQQGLGATHFWVEEQHRNDDAE